jgi:hypothetical protein
LPVSASEGVFQGTLDLDGLAGGVYLVRLGSQCLKLLVD